MGVILKKNDFTNFLQLCKAEAELVAPVKTDILRFEVITDVNKVSLEGNPMVSIKKYFLPNEEGLLQINGTSMTKIYEAKKRIVFGARLCDTNALGILDNLYLEPGHEDLAYKERREKTTIIGYNCKTPPSEYCFCSSMNLQKDYDILFQEHDNENFYLDVQTSKGLVLISKIRQKLELIDSDVEIVMPVTKKTLSQGSLWPFFDKEHWKEDVDECVSCQRCTVLCPTCFCFDLNDEMDLDLTTGVRNRSIDSCHSKDFTRVAGGIDIRETRAQRYMHRVYHKIQSYKDRFGRSMCTGCGRCIQYCHSKIDFVETANKLIEGQE